MAAATTKVAKVIHGRVSICRTVNKRSRPRLQYSPRRTWRIATLNPPGTSWIRTLSPKSDIRAPVLSEQARVVHQTPKRPVRDRGQRVVLVLVYARRKGYINNQCLKLTNQSEPIRTGGKHILRWRWSPRRDWWVLDVDSYGIQRREQGLVVEYDQL